jgi:uncharacterized membrane protein
MKRAGIKGKWSYLKVISGLLLGAITIYGYLNLPDKIAIHFGTSGEPDAYTDKLTGLIFIPAIYSVLFLLFRYLPEIDPLGDNIEEFRESFEMGTSAILVFIAYIQILIVLWNLEASFSISQAVAPAVGFLFYIVGEMISEAEQNWFIGIRTPWTLSSEEVWRRTHARIAPMFKVSGLIALAALVFPEYLVYLVAGPAFFISVYSFAFSYLEYQKVD